MPLSARRATLGAMAHDFDKEYWEQHWGEGAAEKTTAGEPASSGAAAESFEVPVNPYLASELAELTPRTVLDAGCGTGAEAIWLAAHGWAVTGADISGAALGQAAERAALAGIPNQILWVEADLTTWQPDGLFDLVVTNYAHPSIPQLDFYERISQWVAPGGTLLIVGHLHDEHGHDGHDGHTHGAPSKDGHAHDAASAGHDHDQPPAEATVTLAAIAARFSPTEWAHETAAEHERTLTGAHGATRTLSDAVVRLTRRS